MKLIPPDRKRCQANKLEGCWPDAKRFMIIGPRKLVRCSTKPSFVVREKKASKEDGKRGSMSLCATCFAQFIKEFGLDHATITPIK